VYGDQATRGKGEGVRVEIDGQGYVCVCACVCVCIHIHIPYEVIEKAAVSARRMGKVKEVGPQIWVYIYIYIL